jgi:hypothetical protein
MSFIINTLLTLLLSMVLIIPVALNYFVVAEEGSDGIVAGARSLTTKDINILPNLEDFNGYVSFAPQPILDGKLTDTLSLTAFPRQKATYRGLYTIYNLNPNQKIELVNPGILLDAGPVSSGRVLLSLYKNDNGQNLLSTVTAGDTLLNIKDPFAFKEHEKIIFADEMAEIVAVSPDGLVVTPLTRDHEVGSLVWPESIVIEQPFNLVNPKTRSIVLQPGEKALVDALVEGIVINETDGGKEKMQIPLEFRATFVE